MKLFVWGPLETDLYFWAEPGAGGGLVKVALGLGSSLLALPGLTPFDAIVLIVFVFVLPPNLSKNVPKSFATAGLRSLAIALNTSKPNF